MIIHFYSSFKKTFDGTKIEHTRNKPINFDSENSDNVRRTNTKKQAKKKEIK